jgi:trehalose 6-phosphate synthase/phosphatase
MEMNQSHNRPSRLLIVSNRLPFTVVERDGELTIEPSSGGLVSGLAAYLDAVGASGGPTPDYLWAGWPGGTVHETAKPRLKELAQSRFNAYPVFLSKEEMENFYYGFCNSTIWPLFHYFPSYAVYEPEYWETYVRVNRTFCQALMEVIRPDDVIWVHDYQLMLLPGMLREQLPGANIGFFLHIPFPSYEIFRLLPRKWGTALLEGLLGANLVGFHTHDYTRYFLRSVLRILGHEHNMGQILVRDRVVQAETFPMGIDFDRYWHAVSEPRVQAERQALKTKVLAGVKVVLSIDRLDYTKGIINRLKGYRLFLEQHPEWHRKVVLALVVIPSRVGVGRYRETKEHIDELVGRINGEFGGLDWVPIIYQYRSLPFELLVAMYNISDVALVTPLRDGMNLIAKEYIASKPEHTGVLVLSEMAGAAKELGEAIIINPNSLEEIADALHLALTLPEAEQIARNQAMQQRLRRYNVVTWAQDFMQTLHSVKQTQQRLESKLLGAAGMQRLLADYEQARHRLIFLDYDGTLVPFTKDPQAALPDEAVLDLLQRLTEDPHNEVVLISGRDRATMHRWFGGLDVGLVAEHGVWIKERAGDWRMIQPLTNDWKPRIRPLLEMFVDRVPGSFIEEKEFSMAWHYRAADPEVAPVRANELLGTLVDFTANIDVQVLQGNKVIEVKNSGVSKGSAGLRWLAEGEGRWDFILAIGDDWTDEHLFMVLPESAYSIRVGIVQTYARFNLRSLQEVRHLLEQLARNTEQHQLSELRR